MQFVAPQDSNVLLVNVPGKMESGCITKYNSGYKKVCCLHVLKEHVPYLFCLGLLHVATIGLYL
jgi:hypothetical protein